MGSSILASLSEAGRNDPLLSENGPFLPIYQMVRIVWNATQHCQYCKSIAQFQRPFSFLLSCIFNNLEAYRKGWTLP